MSRFGSGTSEAFVNLRASTQDLRGDLQRAQGSTVQTMAGIAGIGAAAAVALLPIREALQRVDPRGGRLRNLTNELRVLKDLYFDVAPRNLLFKAIFGGVDGATEKLRKLNQFLVGARNEMAKNPILSRFFAPRLIPQTGAAQTAIGAFRYGDPSFQRMTATLQQIERNTRHGARAQ